MAHFGLSAGTFRLAVVCGAVSCSSPAPLTASSAVGAAPPSTPQVTLRDADWKTVLLSQYGLLLPLPESSNWRRVETDSWWSAEHRPTGSRIEVKTWNQGQLVDSADCEAQARLWKPDLERATQEETVTEQSAADIAGYRSQVRVLSRATGGAAEPDKTLGVVLVFGASVRSCLALRFRTSAEGNRARSVVASRLALISEAVLPRLTRREIDARVTPLRRAR